MLAPADNYSEKLSDQCKVGPVPKPVKSRAYDASRRLAASQDRRARILAAARAEFLERGYPRTTMTAIAARAGVAADTVYELVGRKPALFRLLVETAISGADQPVDAQQREYVRQIRAEPTPRGKLARYAGAVREIHARLAPLLSVLQAAAGADDDLRQLWQEVSERRAANMRLFAADVAAVATLRTSIDEAADVVWATAAPELYLLLVGQRGWAPRRYERWLADAWERLLLDM
jgi:AcrR family transcriptional regulator